MIGTRRRKAMKAGICETLQEVATSIAAGETSRIALGNFLAFLKPKNIQEAINDAPAILAGQHPQGPALDAYLAAVAELLAVKYGGLAPAWTEDPARFLDHLHYPSHSKQLNDLLLHETPEPFRRRGIVVSANALDVS
jgi:hypothetical protein